MNINKIIAEEVAKNIHIIEENDQLAEGWKDKLAKTFATIALAGGLSSVKLPQKNPDFEVGKPKMDMVSDIPKYKGISDRLTPQQERTKYLNHIKSLRTSEDGRDAIKDHEKLRLRAYKIGDGMITIGWGHAERIGKSRFQVGDAITKKMAQNLFDKDIQTAEKGVKRILLKWYKEDNIKIPVTQTMFDALVSMAFNMGVYGLETSQFMKELKKTQDPIASAEKIKTSRIGKWKGLIPRREKEYQLFTADLNKYDKLMSKLS